MSCSGKQTRPTATPKLCFFRSGFNSSVLCLSGSSAQSVDMWVSDAEGAEIFACFHPLQASVTLRCHQPHKQNQSIMDEAFPLLLLLFLFLSSFGCTVLSVCGEAPERALLQANHSFIIHSGVLTKRWISLYLLPGLVNNRDRRHRSRPPLRLAVVCRSAFFPKKNSHYRFL